MQDDVMISVRLNSNLVKRLDVLAEELKDDPEFAFRARPTRTGLIRECLVRCLPELEQRTRTGRHG